MMPTIFVCLEGILSLYQSTNKEGILVGTFVCFMHTIARVYRTLVYTTASIYMIDKGLTMVDNMQ